MPDFPCFDKLTLKMKHTAYLKRSVTQLQRKQL